MRTSWMEDDWFKDFNFGEPRGIIMRKLSQNHDFTSQITQAPQVPQDFRVESAAVTG